MPVSPSIIGERFQAEMDARERRQSGAHYTSERDILKLIGPLFLDDLKAELEKAGDDSHKLGALHDRLAQIRLLDPASGCGNFLVVAYHELRMLELEILRWLYKRSHLQNKPDNTARLKVNVGQLYGIEIEVRPVGIAVAALRLVDDQIDERVSEEFGDSVVHRPKQPRPHIYHGNALRMDWNDVLPAGKCTHVLGNPPFVGAKFQTSSQRKELAAVARGVKNAGLLDYAAGWYFKAAQYIQGAATTVAFVSTNSICQGEQVGVLWPALFERYRITINFAHRPFAWANEARGKAHVHVVIIGFGIGDVRHKRLFDYESRAGEPIESIVSSINPYLIECPSVTVRNRSLPLCVAPEMQFGNQPIDGGHLILSADERQDILNESPEIERFIRPFLGSREFINSIKRWCLWLKDASPNELRCSTLIMDRIEAVRAFRLKSKRLATRSLADTPSLFAFMSHTDRPYLLVPSVSSERRRFIPTGFMDGDTIASNLCLTIPDATPFHFGVLSSTMHMAWVRHVAGRLESRYRYSARLVYNNFPWPQEVSDAQRAAVEQAAQIVLDTRAAHPGSSLADLYDPLSMPAELATAHARLDRTVDRCYRSQPFATERKRVEYLFTLYEPLASPLLPSRRARHKNSS